MRIFWDPNLWGRAVKHPGNFLSYLTWKMGMRILLRCAIRLDEWETGSARTIDRAYGKEARAPESTVEAGQELGGSQAPSCVFSLLLPWLGGAAKMSWAPMHTVPDAFRSCSPKLCKEISNYDDDDDNGKQT